MANQPTPIEIQKYLSGIDYPVGKDQLLSTASNSHAPQDVLKALQSIPDREYHGPNAVSEAVSDQ